MINLLIALLLFTGVVFWTIVIAMTIYIWMNE